MNLERWLEEYIRCVTDAFSGRVVCIGLQGSRGRGEATSQSDIDMVLILDTVSPADLLRYRDLVDGLAHREMVCGFVSGQKELESWERGELASFYYDTRPLYGDLDFLLPRLCKEDLARGIHAGACALYHSCAHNLVFDRSDELAAQLQKSLFFTLRLRHLWETGEFLPTRARLLAILPAAEAALLTGDPASLPVQAGMLEWASQAIVRFGQRPAGAN